MSMHDCTNSDLISVTEAAARLTALGDRVERSTLSRYVAQHAAALNPVKRGRETVVDFAALREHRAQNIRLGDPKPLAPARAKADSQARKIDAEARLRELDVARAEGLVTSVAEVEDGAHAAVAALRAAFDAATNDTAEALAARTGVEARIVRPFLRQLAVKAQEAFVRSLAQMAPAVGALPLQAGPATNFPPEADHSGEKP